MRDVESAIAFILTTCRALHLRSIYRLHSFTRVSDKKRAAKVPAARSKSICDCALEVESNLRGQGSRRHIVRPAERGKEVVKRVLVSDVDRRELQAHLVFVSLENVVVPDGDVKQTPRRDARRILVVVLGIRCGHLQQR